MDTGTSDQIEDLKNLAIVQLNDVVNFLIAKVNSTNKQISKSNVTDIQIKIEQAKRDFTNAINVAVEYKTNNDSLVEKIENLLNNVDKKMAKTLPQAPPSFANIVKSQPAEKLIRNKVSEETILFTSKPETNSANIVPQVYRAIQTIRLTNEQLKINKIIPTRKGLILKVPADEDIDSLITQFKNYDSLNDAVTIYQPKKLDPTIVLKNVSKLTDINELPQLICNTNLNPLLEDCQNKMIVLFAIKSNTDTQNVVLRVNPTVYEKIMKTGYVYTDLQKIFVQNKIMVRQCQNCFKFDHATKNCNVQKLCIKCGKPTSRNHTCERSCCINCSTNNKYKNTNTDHLPNKRDCPIYNDRIKKLINNTSYTGSDHIIVKNMSASSDGL